MHVVAAVKYQTHFFATLTTLCFYMTVAKNEKKYFTAATPANYTVYTLLPCRPQWPRGLRRGSAAACLLELWVRIPPGHGCYSVLSVV